MAFGRELGLAERDRAIEQRFACVVPMQLDQDRNHAGDTRHDIEPATAVGIVAGACLDEVETLVDPDLLAEIGYKEHSVDLPYCTSQGQAMRMLRWALYTQRYETELVTYQASLDHFMNANQAVMVVSIGS